MIWTYWEENKLTERRDNNFYETSRLTNTHIKVYPKIVALMFL